ALVPVNLGFEVETAGSGCQTHRLRDLRRSELTHEPDCTPERVTLDDRDRGQRGDVDPMVEIVDVDVPRVELLRIVVVELEEVAARTGREHLTIVLFVEHGGKEAI